MPRLSASLCPSCFDRQKVISSNDLMVSSHWNLYPQSMPCLQIYYQTKRLGDCLLAHRVGARTQLSWSPLHHTAHWKHPLIYFLFMPKRCLWSAAWCRTKLQGRVLTIKEHRQSSPSLSPVSFRNLCRHKVHNWYYSETKRNNLSNTLVRKNI